MWRAVLWPNHRDFPARRQPGMDPRHKRDTAFQSASGWMNLFTPTSAVVMGGLALSRVGYNRYLRFLAPLLGILLILTCLFMLLGVAIPALGGTVT